MSVRPVVSVIIPAYNAEPFLDEALQSLVAQTLTDWEAWLVDDGSVDSTATIARRWSARDGRIHLVQQANAGAARARNTALEKCRGEFVALLDADDLWHAEKLERQVAILRQGLADVVYCQPIHFCPASGRNWESPDWDQFSGALTAEDFFVLHYVNFFVLPSSVMMRTSVLQALGGFDASLKSAEDWELWLRISQAGYSFYGQKEKLLRYREHRGGLSRAGDFAATLAIFPRYCGSPLLRDHQRRKPFRLNFRNSFTYLKANNRVHEAKALFDLYRPQDPDGRACQVMLILRHLLPTGLFWLLCRFVVIPLAWHLEAWSEQRQSDRGGALEHGR